MFKRGLVLLSYVEKNDRMPLLFFKNAQDYIEQCTGYKIGCIFNCLPVISDIFLLFLSCLSYFTYLLVVIKFGMTSEERSPPL